MHSVTIVKQVKIEQRWQTFPAAFDKRKKIKPHRVIRNGQEELHPEGTYLLLWRENGQRRSLGVGTDPILAEQTRERKRGELMAGITTAPVAKPKDDLSISDAISRFLAKYDNQLTCRTYRPILDAFSTFILKRRTYLSQVTREDLLDYAAERSKLGDVPKTVNNKLTAVASLLKRFDLPPLLKKNDYPKVVETIRPIYEIDELKQFFAGTRAEETVRFKFFLMTGFRDREVQFSSWRDLDVKNAAVRVTAKPHWGFKPKNYEERQVPVPRPLIELLQIFRPGDVNLDAPIFPTKAGRPDTDMISMLKEAAWRLKLNCGRCVTKYGNRCSGGPYCQRWFLHKFRHTFATMHLEGNINIRTVQVWMGHKDLKSTEVYTKALKNTDAHERIKLGAMATL